MLNVETASSRELKTLHNSLLLQQIFCKSATKEQILAKQARTAQIEELACELRRRMW